MTDEVVNPYELEKVSSEPGGLNKDQATTYRALVIAEQGFAIGNAAGISIFNDSMSANITVDISSSTDMNFLQTGEAVLNAVVSSSVPYTIARTRGFLTVIFGYDSSVIPEIVLTGNFANCNYYYADPTRDLIIDSDGNKQGTEVQTGQSMPVKILTHVLAAAAGYAACSATSEEA